MILKLNRDDLDYMLEEILYSKGDEALAQAARETLDDLSPEIFKASLNGNSEQLDLVSGSPVHDNELELSGLFGPF